MSTPASAADVVRSCLGLLAAGDVKGGVALLDPEVEWRNTGLPTLRGPRALDAFAALDKRRVGFSVEIHHLATDDSDPSVVLTDRTDVLSYGRLSTSFWVCGTFRVRDGRIVLWDDHFSMGSFAAGSVRGLVGAVLPRR